MPVSVDHAGPGLFYHFPVLPAKLLLPTTLRPGTRISIQGTVPPDASRFAINLQSGTEKATSSVLFHFNPRFKEGPVVVRNSRTEGSWLQEERTDSTEEFPFTSQEDFRLVITPNEECYEVVVNDRPFITYVHRQPLESATHLVIKGDVFIRTVNISTELPLKLVTTIGPQLNVGDVIILKGRANPDAKRIKVNIQSNENDDADVLLHVNPRFEENDIILNTRSGGEWGGEERPGSLGFLAGEGFTLGVAAAPDHYKVLVNGSQIASYNHRVPLNTGSVLLVDGDLELLRLDIDSQVPFLPGLQRAVSLLGVEPKVHAVHPTVPCAIDIPGGLSPGNVVIITGEPNKDPDSIRFNLQAQDSDVSRSADDVSLHINPRWSESTVVINNRQGGNWGQEERLLVDGRFPFEANRHFDVIVAVEPDCYVITVDGQLLGRAGHREPGPAAAQSINLRGEVQIRRVLVV